MVDITLPSTRNLLADRYGGRRVLIVGADGFLGCNCVRLLTAVGAEVSVLTRRPEPRMGNGVAHVYRGDLLDEALLAEAVAGQDEVCNFAGVSSAVDSNLSPETSLSDMCLPSLRLFKVCAQASPQPRVIFASTRLVYGIPSYLPVDERHPLAPQSMYAVHKLTLEHTLSVLHQTRGLPYNSFRISNPYGPYQRPGVSQYGVINHFIRSAACNSAIKIFGDGRQRRDYIYVDDAIAIMLRVAVDASCDGEIFNLGGRSIMAIVDAAETISELAGGSPVELIAWPDDYRIVETGDYFTDLSKLEAMLDLPEMTKFETGVRLSLDYYRDNPNA